MGFDQMLNNLEKFTSKLLAKRDAHALSLGFDAVALVSNRVQRKGMKSSGQKFKTPYSQNNLKSYYFPDRFVKYARKSGQKLSYENYRKFLGLPTNIRNLTLTGGMWASIKPEVVESNDNRVVVEWKSGNDDKQKLVNVNSDREDTNILSLNDAEIKILDNRTRKFMDELTPN